MLRAHLPGTFKQPGTNVKVALQQNQQTNLLMVTPEVQDRLIELRQESLRRLAAQRAELAALPATSG